MASPARPSGGDPGSSDAVNFSGNANDDLADDGITALLQHTFGTSESSSDPEPVMVGVNCGRLTVSAQVNHGADDVSISLERSTDLTDWADARDQFFTTTGVNNGDGTTTRIFQSTSVFFDGEVRRFLRLQADLN